MTYKICNVLYYLITSFALLMNSKLFKFKGYTAISNEIIVDPNISMKAKAVYCYLQSRPDNWEFYTKEIVKNFKESKDCVVSALKELETNHYLKRIAKRNNGKFSNFDYYIFNSKDEFNKFTEAENINSVETGVKITESVKTVSDFSVTNNTNYNNTDIINNINIIKEIDKEKINKETISPILLIDKFIELCPLLPRPLKTVNSRNKNLINLFNNKSLLNEDDKPLFETMDDWITYLEDYVSKSSFLIGNNKAGWKADIDFIIKPSNVIKIYEGKYFNKNDNNI